MIPSPSIQFIPKISQDNQDVGWLSLTAAIDNLTAWTTSGVRQFDWFLDPAKCPSLFLPELNFLLSAGVNNQDTERQARQKIANAVAGHKTRTFWTTLKLRLDTYTGYSAQLYISVDNDDDIRLADPTSGSASYFWGTRNALDGTGDNTLGVARVAQSPGTLFYIKGYIAIDLHTGIHTAVLTTAQIDAIKADIANDYTAAYIVLLLGYTDSSGAFVLYSGGTL